MNAPDFDPFGLDGADSASVRLLERQAAWVHTCEPTAALTRTRDVLQFDVQRGDYTATLLVTTEALELRLPTVECPTPYLPLASTQLWKRVVWSRIGSDQALQALIDEAFAARRREFVPCRFCHEPTPPEHRHGRVCHGCAEGHLCIVH